VNVERIQGWRCIGCGKVDAPRPCIGVCQDRKCELVTAADYDALLARCRALESVLALIARITPRDEEWQASWQALQARARKVMGDASGA
jgi:hypothetical protein